MAVKQGTVVRDEQRNTIVTWADLDQGDTGSPIRISGNWTRMSVQITAGAGTVHLEGSNDGVNYSLFDSDALLDDDNLYAVLVFPLFIRPIASVADNNTVVLIAGGNAG